MTINLPDIADRPVLIAGPTASGKSALAMQIAEKFGGQIVNADAIQVFDGWRVLTARPSEQDEARLPHRLYGHVPVNGTYSVGHWLREIAPILSESQRPIIVGGTGLYFAALTQGLAQIPQISSDVRQQADAMRQNGELEIMLADLDAKTRAGIDTQNPMRVQRAWEVWRETGRQIAQWQDETPAPLLPLSNVAAFVLDADKDWLNARIVQRFDKMLEEGALEEARQNLADWDPNRLSSKAIGAPELIAHLKGQLTLDEAREKATTSTRQYAKRQRTWFRARMKKWCALDPANL